MNAPFAPAHSPFGGSRATRILRCPGSVSLTEKVPAALHRLSIHAERGTALHAAITLLLDAKESFESLVSQTIGSYAITHDDVENALRPVFTYITALLDTPEAEFYLEQRIVFPTVAGAFGTADLIVRIGDTIHVADLKFGPGVRVLALYPDGDEDVINEQLLFYAAGARYSLPEFFVGVKNIVLTIVQPQSIELDAEMVSSVEVTHAELDEFIAVYRNACAEALSDSPRLKRGDWCRFCPAKPICPEHTKPLLDFAQLAELTPALSDDALVTSSKEAYLELLARALNLFDTIKDYGTTLREQAKRALESGDAVPGYALTAGRAERHWRDDERTTITALESLGLNRDDIVAETIRTPKQMEIRAKARGLKIPRDFIVSHRSGVSLVRSENAHAPVPARSELVQSFSAALETFRNRGKP